MPSAHDIRDYGDDAPLRSTVHAYHLGGDQHRGGGGVEGRAKKEGATAATAPTLGGCTEGGVCAHPPGASTLVPYGPPLYGTLPSSLNLNDPGTFKSYVLELSDEDFREANNRGEITVAHLPAGSVVCQEASRDGLVQFRVYEPLPAPTMNSVLPWAGFPGEPYAAAHQDAGAEARKRLNEARAKFNASMRENLIQKMSGGYASLDESLPLSVVNHVPGKNPIRDLVLGLEAARLSGHTAGGFTEGEWRGVQYTAPSDADLHKALDNLPADPTRPVSYWENRYANLRRELEVADEKRFQLLADLTTARVERDDARRNLDNERAYGKEQRDRGDMWRDVATAYQILAREGGFRDD